MWDAIGRDLIGGTLHNFWMGRRFQTGPSRFAHRLKALRKAERRRLRMIKSSKSSKAKVKRW